jgi:hypothetical protein
MHATTARPSIDSGCRVNSGNIIRLVRARYKAAFPAADTPHASTYAVTPGTNQLRIWHSRAQVPISRVTGEVAPSTQMDDYAVFIGT